MELMLMLPSRDVASSYSDASSNSFASVNCTAFPNKAHDWLHSKAAAYQLARFAGHLAQNTMQAIGDSYLLSVTQAASNRQAQHQQ